MLRGEVTEAEVVDMEAVAISEDTTAEDIMADTIMAVAFDFILEHTGDPTSIIGDGHTTTPIIGGGHITIPTMGDGHIPIPAIPILFLQLLRRNRKNSNLIIGISVRIHRVTTPTLKIVRAVGCRWYHG